MLSLSLLSLLNDLIEVAYQRFPAKLFPFALFNVSFRFYLLFYLNQYLVVRRNLPLFHLKNICALPLYEEIEETTWAI